MARISIKSAQSFMELDEALREFGFEELSKHMDNDIRETVHAELSPCSEFDFLTRYLEISPVDLVVG